MEWWKDSPIQPLIKVYIFNYTNIDEYLMSPRRNKIKVEEVGPYVFKEFGSRVNLKFEDEKITFNVSRFLKKYFFMILQ
jgi:scavenger receptor class B, member 1